MKTNSQWPKGITEWIESSTLFMSIPFTWLLSKAKERILPVSYTHLTLPTSDLV